MVSPTETLREQEPRAAISDSAPGGCQLSSLSVKALEVRLGVRSHRNIENGLHWVRDVVFNEDAAPFAHCTSVISWSVLRSITINLLRSYDYHSLTQASTRFFTQGFLRLISCRASSPPCSYSYLKR